MNPDPRSWFDDYVHAFNHCEFDRLGSYYADDVQFFGQAAQLRGREAVIAFYRLVKSRLTETLHVRQFVGGENRIAVELETWLHARVAWPDFPTGPLAAGQTIGSLNFVFYDLHQGRFTRIRSARYQRLAEPNP